MSTARIVFFFIFFLPYYQAHAMQQSQELLRAIQMGYLDQVKEFLKNPEININAQDRNGCTPLHWAILCDHPDIVQELLNHGANTTIQTKSLLQENDGYTVLHLAVMKESLEVIDLLLKQTPGLINMGNNNFNTPLHLAVTALSPNIKIIKKLIECRVLINAKNKKNLTALQMTNLNHQDVIDIISHVND